MGFLFYDMEYSEFKNIVDKSNSKSDICKYMGLKLNGSGFRKVTEMLKTHNVDISHFDFGRSKLIKHNRFKKKCPVCSSEFEVVEVPGRKNKVTCSYSCSNTYFRSNVNNPNWKESSYRSTCFVYHKKECIICGELNIVDVHHYDEDRTNNSPENLIPLCPTHHMYVHSRYKSLVISSIDSYLQSWKETFKNKIEGVV
jgi:hypothetical protein